MTHVQFIYRKDEDKEVPVLRSLNRFLSATMKQCWRFKHHPLTKGHDLYQILPGVDLPIEDLMEQVTDKIEENDRRIVGIDKDTGGFMVYCPSVDALTDLWAMCDVINRALVGALFSGEENEVLRRFKVENASVRTFISGPEYLRYKCQVNGTKYEKHEYQDQTDD